MAINPLSISRLPGAITTPPANNFQTIGGQNTATAMPPLSQFAALGAKAKAPEQNVVKPMGTLPSNQVTAYKPPIVTTNTQNSAPNSGGTQNPNANYFGNQQNSVANNTPTNTGGLYGSLINNLSTFNPMSNPAVSGAYQKAQDINSQIEKSKMNEAGAIAQNNLQPIPIGDQQGRARVLQDQYLQQQNALASQFQGQTNLYNAGLTGTGQTLSGLGTAAGHAQPQLSQFGQGYYDPLNPQGGAASAGGGALNPINNVQSIAQQVISGQLSPSQAYSMGGSVSNWQSLLNSAIQQSNPGANLAQLEGNYNARQQNTQTAGTAVTSANASAYAANLQPYLQLQNTVQNVDQFGQLLLQTMGGINPLVLKQGNQTLAQIRGQLSSSDQAQYDTTLAALRSKISGLLSVGGNEIPTDISSDARKILDGSLPASQMNAVLSRIGTEGKILLSNQAQLVNQPLQTAGGSSAGQVGGGSHNPLGI